MNATQKVTQRTSEATAYYHQRSLSLNGCNHFGFKHLPWSVYFSRPATEISLPQQKFRMWRFFELSSCYCFNMQHVLILLIWRAARFSNVLLSWNWHSKTSKNQNVLARKHDTDSAFLIWCEVRLMGSQHYNSRTLKKNTFNHFWSREVPLVIVRNLPLR